MKTIKFNAVNLSQVYNDIQRCLISNDTGDACYPITNYEMNYHDESSIHILTYGISKDEEVDLEEFAKVLTSYLPQEIQEDFTKEEHLLLDDGKLTTLAIHLNDSTVTCILHFTGQW